MRKNFLTGLAILLPIVITFWTVFFLVNFLTNPFLHYVQETLTYYHLQDHPFFIFTGPQILVFASRLFILLMLFCILVLAGFFARVLIINQLFRLGDYLIHRIPFVNKIYKATQDVTQTLFNADIATFSQVVLVQYPHAKCHALGFLTGNKDHQMYHTTGFNDKVSVLLLGTPNPTMGFILVYKRDEIVYLDMKPEDALKFVISCAVMMPEFKVIDQPGLG